MTRALHTVVTARKSYECGWLCGRPIEPGQRHVRSSLPPGEDPNNGPTWWTMRLHGHTREACPSWSYDEVDPCVEASERPDLVSLTPASTS